MERIVGDKSARQSTLPFVNLAVVVFASSLLLIVFYLEEGRGAFNNRSRQKLKNNHRVDSQAENELPPCIGNLLDQRQYLYEKETNGSHYDSSSRFWTDSGSCRLLNYTTERIVTCFDALRDQQVLPPGTPLHFLFIGDSIIRQQYLNLVRLIPDYDKILQPSDAVLLFQGDMEVTSVILGLRLSFKWQPFVSDDLVNAMGQWENSHLIQRPHMILLSMAAWHMFHVEHRDHRRYEKKVSELAPVLAQLSNFTRVIWLNQYPAVEIYGDNNAPCTHVTSKKLNNYNVAVRRILLQNQNSINHKVQIWDSGNPLVEEYVRSCGIFKRYEKKKISPGLLTLKYYSGAYRNCRSDIHAGYSVLSQITQLLLNDICSATLFSVTKIGRQMNS